MSKSAELLSQGVGIGGDRRRAQPVERRRPRILVVDDEPRSLELLVRTLRRLGDVATAGSGEEAWNAAQAAPPDVVVSDQRMPGMTGSELLARIAERDRYCARLILTGYSDIDATIRAINEGGVHAYLSKPWKPDELVGVVKGLIERVELERRNQDLLQELTARNEELEIAMSRLRKAHHELLTNRGPADRTEGLGEPIARRAIVLFPGVAASLRRLSDELDSLSLDEIRGRARDIAREAERLTRPPSDFASPMEAAVPS